MSSTAQQQEQKRIGALNARIRIRTRFIAHKRDYLIREELKLKRQRCDLLELENELQTFDFFGYLPDAIVIIISFMSTDENIESAKFYDKVTLTNKVYKSVCKRWKKQLGCTPDFAPALKYYRHHVRTEEFSLEFLYVELAVGTYEALKLFWFKQNAEHKWETFLELGLEKRRKELAKNNTDKNVDCVILDVLI